MGPLSRPPPVDAHAARVAPAADSKEAARAPEAGVRVVGRAVLAGRMGGRGGRGKAGGEGEEERARFDEDAACDAPACTMRRFGGRDRRGRGSP